MDIRIPTSSMTPSDGAKGAAGAAQAAAATRGAYEVTISDSGIEVAKSAPAVPAPRILDVPAMENSRVAEQFDTPAANGQPSEGAVVYDIRGRMGAAPRAMPGQILDLTG